VSSNNAIREQCRKALNEIFLRTSESAFQRKPHLHVPSRVRGRILDFGEELADFCKGERHMVPRTVFQVFADDRKELILQHFSSCWLEETVAYIREMHKGFHTNSPAAWPDTVDVVREFFGFNLSETPPIFQAWLGRALETEVRFLDRWIERGLPVGGLIEDWNKIASSLAQVFRRQLQKVLKELRREPSLARRSQPSELGKIPRESRGGRSQPNASPPEFKHSSDYREICLNGEQFSTTERQAKDIQILHEAYRSGNPDLPVAEFTRGQLRDHFKPGGTLSPLWGTLIIHGSKKKHWRLRSILDSK
jgi:hypothetical protein